MEIPASIEPPDCCKSNVSFGATSLHQVEVDD